MPESLPSWPRTHFEPGGGNPFLFYVVFGDINQSIPLSRTHYRVQSVPEKLDIMAYGPNSNPDAVHSFREGYLWENLVRSDNSFASIVADQKSCLVIRGTFSDAGNLDYLRDTIGLITYFLDYGGVAVYDPHMFEWWSPEKWRERIFDPAAAVPRHHVVILISEESNKNIWIHTRGLRKFGRPDISIRNIPGEWKEGAIDLCNRFIEFQAFGGLIAEGKEIKTSTFPTGYHCFHRGHLDDPDFNNVHVSIEP